MINYYVYIVKTAKNKLYTGITNNIERRLYEHNHTKKGAKSLRGQRPVMLLWRSCPMSKSEALKEERRIKKLSRKDKEKVVEITIGDHIHYWVRDRHQSSSGRVQDFADGKIIVDTVSGKREIILRGDITAIANYGQRVGNYNQVAEFWAEAVNGKTRKV